MSYADIQPELIELAGVHFTFVGFGATTMAASLAAESIGRRRAAAVAAGSALVAADLTVALGHVTARPVELVGTAAVAGSVFAMAALGWHALPADTLGRMFARLSGLAVVTPMAFAIAYSWALTTDSAHLSYDTIAAVHGSLNAFGFVTCGLVAWRVGARPIGSPGLRKLAIEVWGTTVLAGVGCGLLCAGAWSLMYFFMAAPVGALVGFALGLPLALVISVVLAWRPDLLLRPGRLQKCLSTVGLVAGVALCAPLNLWLLVAVLENNDAGWSELAIINALGATTAVAAIGWISGRRVARRHLQRIGAFG